MIDGTIESIADGFMNSLRIDAVDAFTDNYIWILDDGTHAVVVDPGLAEPVQAYLDARELQLAALLLTHHHADHIGGVNDLLDRTPCPVFGPPDARIPAVNRPCSGGDTVRIDRPSLEFRVVETPGHTTSHIAFHGDGRLFCGDTLFSVGCGRMFEGTAPQMLASLDALAALPDATRVFCAHEYTRANCEFAQRVDPDNGDLADRCQEVKQLRQDQQRTLPSLLGQEKRCNPFLRARDPSVVRAAQSHDPDCDGTPSSVFAVLRRWKDNY